MYKKIVCNCVCTLQSDIFCGKRYLKRFVAKDIHSITLQEFKRNEGRVQGTYGFG